MKDDDGGPAFPFPLAGPGGDSYWGGMSLRDWFAGQALPKCLKEEWGEFEGTKLAAEGAYQIADAMLEARKEAKEKP